MIARFGGEEFAIMLPETNLQDAVALANALRLEVEKTKIKNEKGKQLPSVTISIGVSVLGDLAVNNEDTLIEMIAASDEALYRAKKNGRNCVSE